MTACGTDARTRVCLYINCLSSCQCYGQKTLLQKILLQYIILQICNSCIEAIEDCKSEGTLSLRCFTMGWVEVSRSHSWQTLCWTLIMIALLSSPIVLLICTMGASGVLVSRAGCSYNKMRQREFDIIMLWLYICVMCQSHITAWCDTESLWQKSMQQWWAKMNTHITYIIYMYNVIATLGLGRLRLYIDYVHFTLWYPDLSLCFIAMTPAIRTKTMSSSRLQR